MLKMNMASMRNIQRKKVDSTAQTESFDDEDEREEDDGKCTLPAYCFEFNFPLLVFIDNESISDYGSFLEGDETSASDDDLCSDEPFDDYGELAD